MTGTPPQPPSRAANPGSGPLAPDVAEALAGQYVLGTLPAELRRDVQARLPREPLLRTALLEWEERLLPLASLVESAEPTPSLWARIDRSIDSAQNAANAPAASQLPAQGEFGQASAAVSSLPAAQAGRRATTPPDRPRSLWQSLPLWRGLSGAGFAAAAVLAAVLISQDAGGPGSTTQYLVVLAAPQTQAAGWVVQVASPRQLKLVPVGAAAPLPEQKALQFWTKAEGWDAPVSLGLVAPNQAIRISLDKLPPLQPNQLFELTLEPATGSSTGRPTGPIQFIGRAVEVRT